jgi:hypothetical protein
MVKYLKNNKGELGMSTILGVVVSLVVTAFVVVPGLRDFASVMMDGMNSWWINIISPEIFPTL